MKISVRPVNVRDARKWVVSWQKPGEKRKRLYFDTKTAADTEAETMRGQQKRCGEVWLSVSAERRDEIVRLMEDAAREGFTIREAADFFRANRSRISKLVNIGEAYKKFIAEMEAALISKRSIKAYRSNVGRFIAGRELLPLSSITRDDVLVYLRRPEWGPRTFNSYHRGNGAYSFEKRGAQASALGKLTADRALSRLRKRAAFFLDSAIFRSRNRYCKNDRDIPPFNFNW